MNKHIILFSLFIFLYSFAYPQNFDDMAYSNPDMATYFQQEMTSLMRFQEANNLNVPFFVSFSGKILPRADNYSSLFSQFSGYGSGEGQRKPPENSGGNFEIAVLSGIQIKLNETFFLLPVLYSLHTSITSVSFIRKINYKGTIVREPVIVNTGSSFSSYFGSFLGSGLFINTDKIKGGVYMGWGNVENSYNVRSPSLYSFMQENGLHDNIFDDTESQDGTKTNSFKIALIPLVNTSEWKYIGKVLDNILGYFGLGDALMNFTEKDEDSKAAAAASAINAALDFTFNRIHWGNLSLDIQAMYTRGNFDAAAKADTYGAKVSGMFSNFPFGFTLEGGYKRFYAFASPQHYFAEGYPNGTGYFNGNIYFPIKRVTLGLIYQYDNVNKSTFGIALSSNTFSGFGLLGSNNNMNLETHQYPHINYGLRFRWNGWKADK